MLAWVCWRADGCGLVQGKCIALRADTHKRDYSITPAAYGLQQARFMHRQHQVGYALAMLAPAWPSEAKANLQPRNGKALRAAVPASPFVF
jgi:hypothetical protein